MGRDSFIYLVIVTFGECVDSNGYFQIKNIKNADVTQLPLINFFGGKHVQQKTPQKHTQKKISNKKIRAGA